MSDKLIWGLIGGSVALGLGWMIFKQTNQGLGRNRGTSPGAGPGGYCVCPSCGYSAPHTTGVPCYLTKCPSCGNSMMR